MVKTKSTNTIIIGVVLAVIVLAVLVFINRSTGYAILTDNAMMVSQSVPTGVMVGQPLTFSITMKNTGTTTWTAANGYKLGSQNPQDNTNWGISRITLGPSESIAPGQTKTFSITVAAPTSAGTYNFQWQMVKEKVAWFGSKTTNSPIVVSVSQPTTPPSLSCYPNQFIEKKIASNTVFVVGSTASSSDTFAVLDVASNLQYALVNPCTGVVPISNPITMADSEVTNPQNYNLILVGTDGYNTLIPRYKISSAYNHGSIQIANNGANVALLILGKTNTDTRAAAKAVSYLASMPNLGQVVCVNENSQIVAC